MFINPSKGSSGISAEDVQKMITDSAVTLNKSVSELEQKVDTNAEYLQTSISTVEESLSANTVALDTQTQELDSFRRSFESSGVAELPTLRVDLVSTQADVEWLKNRVTALETTPTE